MGRRLDLVGQIFDRLTVVKDSGKRSSGDIMWECVCTCGNVVYVRGASLKNKLTKSCGCLNNENAAELGRKSKLDLTGQKFGYLTVIKDSGLRAGKAVIWICKCDCGKEKNIRRASLVAGRTKSCGCMKGKMAASTYSKHFPEGSVEAQDISERRKTTAKDHYGVENVMDNPEIFKKARENLADYWEKNGYQSKPEREIHEYVQSLGLTTKHCYIGNRDLDVYIPEKSIGIEHNGLYYHREGKSNIMDKNYHLNKTELAKKHGIRLIHIWGHEWQFRRTQVKNYLKSALGMNNIKIGARKCELREIDKVIAWEFIDQHHIQPPNKMTILALGLYFEQKLISVATFSKHHRGTDKIVLDRFVCCNNCTISGGLSKFTKYASNCFKQDLITWAHRTISEGTGYLNSGWLQEDILEPDYFYINPSGKVIPKQNFKHLTKVKTGRTEAEHVKDINLTKIWDCGKIRFIYNYLP